MMASSSSDENYEETDLELTGNENYATDATDAEMVEMDSEDSDDIEEDDIDNSEMRLSEIEEVAPKKLSEMDNRELGAYLYDLLATDEFEEFESCLKEIESLESQQTDEKEKEEEKKDPIDLNEILNKLGYGDAEDCPLLLYAVWTGNVSIVELLLKKYNVCVFYLSFFFVCFFSCAYFC